MLTCGSISCANMSVDLNTKEETVEKENHAENEEKKKNAFGSGMR